MMELVLVRQRMFVDGIECTVTELMPNYPLLTKFHGPFARIIALPGQSASSETSRTPATAPGSCGLQMMTGKGGAGGNGNASRRG
ncbi:hypothetical protein DSECCO2_470160 [anaerobic digester metagenome]